MRSLKECVCVRERETGREKREGGRDGRGTGDEERSRHPLESTEKQRV